ncbi:MAG: tandem-95 repeat protein [Pirellulales bacterium]
MTIRKNARTREMIRRKRLQDRKSRQMLFEALELREMMTTVHPIYAPGTPPDRMLPDVIDPNAGGDFDAFQTANRWTATATNPTGLQRGDATTLTWSIVRDGLSIAGFAGEQPNPSDLVSFLDGIYGNSGATLDQRPWFPILQQAFTTWGQSTGVTYVYEPNDDGAQFGPNIGQLGVRGDIRVGGHPIDGQFGILAYNFFPNNGEMVIDTSDSIFYGDTAGNSLGLRNVLAHEAGHGLGLNHTCPIDETKLMEPFLTYAFDGPQEDDILSANRLYGDRYEPSDAAAQSINLGTVTTAAVGRDTLSIDGLNDVDYFQFTITQPSRASVLLRPTGSTYLEGPQNPDSSCSAGTPFNAKALNDLSIEVLDSNGSTVLAIANAQPAGINELLTNVNLPSAGTYYLRVRGAVDQVQMYGLDLSLAGTSAAGPVLIGIQPNDVGLFDVDNPFDTTIPANNTLTESPSQLTFRFDAAAPIDAATLAGIQITRTGFDDRFDTAWAATDMATAASAAILDITAVKLGTLENNIKLVFTKSDLGANAVPTVTVTGQTIDVVLNSHATTPTTAEQLVEALTTDAEAKVLVKTQLRTGSLATADVTGVANGFTVQLGGAGVPVASTDLGAAFPLELRLTALNAQAGQPISVGIFKGTAPAGVPIAAPVAGAPTVYVDNQRIYVRVANVGTTTAAQIAAAINNDAKAKLLVSASVAFGDGAVDVVPTLPAQTIEMLGKDVVVTPGFKGLGTTTREVITRFAETLPDDKYRVEIYGADNATAGQTALKNLSGQVFQPTFSALGQEINEFEVKLGAQITAVVPQPVTRATGPGGAFAGITQARDQIEVYFNEDDLLDDNTSAENPNFYQLIFTNDSVQNTDDVVYTPTVVSYDPLANKATLTFANELHLLGSGAGTFRLRIGTAEDATPPTPVTVNRPADVGSSFGASDVTAISISASNVTSTIVTSTISSSAPQYTLDFPGALDEPGHRQVQVESHFSGGVDGAGIVFQAFNFKDVYGTDPFGAILHNQITEEQKQRARQVLELFSRYSGIRFYETADQGLTIVTGDLRALDPTIPTGPGGVIGLAESPGTLAIMDGTEPWDNEFGADWFETAMHEIGHNLGLGHSYDLPQSIMGALSGVVAYNLPTEAVWPLDSDIEHLQYLYRPEVRDVDMYRFDVPAGTSGELSIETFADRLPLKTAANGSLDTQIRLYRQNPDGSRELVAQNDDYYGDDSFLSIPSLSEGTYYIGVSAKGTSYDPAVPNSGMGGLSEGDYQLRVNFRPAATTSIVDLDGSAFDGDGDGAAGGVYNFWFRAQTPANTLFVDKSAPNGGSGTAAAPYNNLTTAFNAAPQGTIVRVIGNPGADNNLATVGDNQAYEIGTGPLSSTLSDGATLVVPKNVTVMVDAGAIFKVQGTRIGVGSTTTSVDRSGGALQVLGTPDRAVIFTSFNDESIGVDTSPIPTTPSAGNWGGLDFREEVDRGQGRFTWDRQGIFLNYVNHADMRYGGGRVQVDSTTQTVRPIDMSSARVTATFNTIRQSAEAAMGATPDTFEETNFNAPRYQTTPFTPDYDRVGPEIYGNTILNNSMNGLFVAIKTPAGNNLVPLTVAARFDDTDIVHLVADNLTIKGQAGGAYLEQVAPAVNLVTLVASGSGNLAAGNYSYRIVNIDANGNEGVASVATSTVAVGANGRVVLGQLPPATGDFVGRRLYRSFNGGAYSLVAEIDKSATTYADTRAAGSGALLSTAAHLRPRIDARLAIDPGTVVKLEGGRFEVIDGGNLIAEGTEGREVIFTAKSDDRYGGSGTFDTNNDDSAGAAELQPGKGNWGGIYFGPLSTGSISHSLVTFGGGVVAMEGDFAGVNPIEIQQADVRIADSEFESNANGAGGTAPSTRFGRGTNTPATIFVRGSQPVIVNNIIRNNDGSAISINANALSEILVSDQGQQTYPVNQVVDYRDNQGPLVRGNKLQGNGTNGMTVRGEILQTESVWDDTDIVHVLTSQILVPDFHTDGGLRLHSSPTESLVVKLQGAAAGFVASGRPTDITDRIGGTVQILGQPGFPVILTSLRDDSVGAGFQPDGTPQTDTNGATGLPTAGDWNSIKFDAFSNDRNVAVVLERESPDVVAPGINSTPATAQYLGDLASEEKSSDENLRLGFEVHGVISQPTDLDVYSFNGAAGSEVWIDIDRTSIPFNAVVELLDSDGNLLARSDDSHTEKAAGTLPYVSDPVTVKAFPMPKAPAAFGPRDSIGGLSKDTYTQNPFDAGFRVTLPGTAGERSVFHIRVSSSSGQTSGVYQMQVRLRETDEFPGSTVQYADIRYATNGIELIGVPYHSPLLAEARESTGDNAGVGGSQDLGNLFNSDRGAISVAGNISTQGDQDFYRIKLKYDGIQGTQEGPGLSTYISATFDIDYSDGLARGNTSMWIFDSTGRLVAVGRDSNIADDQPEPLNGVDSDNLSGGSAGKLDPFIGPINLATTTADDEYYAVAVTSDARIPSVMDQFLVQNPTNSAIRLEPVNSVDRIAEQHFGSGGGTAQATANAPQVPVLFNTTTGQVPYHLGDVVLFVSRNGQLNGSSGTGIATVDPFTGAVESSVGGFGQLSGDLALRRSEGTVINGVPDFGNIFTLSNGVAGSATDGNSGNLLRIDAGTAAVTNMGDDGIVTYRDDPNTAGIQDQAIDVGVQFKAMTFTDNSGTNLFAVGSRGQNNWGGTTTNVVYQFNAQTGAAVSPNPGNRAVGQNPTQVLLANSAGTQIRELGQITGVAGEVTGLTSIGGTFYVSTDAGGIYRLNGALVGTLIANAGESLEGLSAGPTSVEGGLYANSMFAIATDGTIYAYNTAGIAQPFFANNETSVETGIAGATGLAFSNLDRNLWHTTSDRDTEAGHGINVPNDSTRLAGDGSNSLYFGSNGAASGTADNKYNFPGGAHGTIISNPFSLKGYSADDQPTMYFTYFMETEPNDQDYAPGVRTQPDAFRVYIAGDDGNWSLLGTNNTFQSAAQADERDYGVGDGACSYPDAANQPCVQELFQNSGTWRQARLPLDLFAGQENLRLRFEFNTAGSASVGNISTTGEELRAVSADKLRDGQTITIDGLIGGAPATRTFEVDLDPTLVVPTGAAFGAGGTITVDGPIGAPVVFTLSAAATAGTNIQVLGTRTPAQIATDLATRINAAGLGITAVVTDGNRVNLSSLTGVVTAAPVGLPAGFVEGASGAGANIPLNIRADMTNSQVATVLRTALANTFAGGNLTSIKSDEDLVRMIRMTVADQDGGAFNGMPFGLEVELPGDVFGENDEAPSGLLATGALSNAQTPSRRGVDNNREGVYIDDIIIGFAERGEMVTGAVANTTFRDNLELLNTNLPATNTQTLVGEYQLEVRRTDDYWVDNLIPAPPRIVADGMDSNDRGTQAITITAPAGDQIFDGQTFVLSDGVDTLTFEFEDLALLVGNAQKGVTAGRVQVGYRATWTDDQVAEAIRDAINSAPVQGILDFTAGLSDGTNTGAGSTSAQVHLYGNASRNTSGATTAIGLTTEVHNHFGDLNQFRDQGQVIISSNLIRDAAQYGILVDAGARDRSDLAGSAGFPGVLPHPGAPINFDDLNSERLAPGAVLMNNVVVRGGAGGIRVSGDNTASLDAAVPFVRVVNNTIYGRRQSDTGIVVDQFASPTILNNILANLSTGIRIVSDASTNTSVVGSNLYQNNGTNAVTPGTIGVGSTPVLLAVSDPLFVDAANGNFYLAAGSQAIDSSIGSLGDRNDFATRVKQPLGIAASPILAPDHDITGQLRFDDPSITSALASGANVNIDRGAYDRNDFSGPFAELVVPRDNDAEGRDIDGTITVVQLTEGVYSSFDIVLKDGLGSNTPVEGTGIDQSTVNVDNITVARDGILLRPTIDYIIGFQAGSNLLRITPLSGVWRNDVSYVITLSGIRDLAGNMLQPNQADGSTRFTILMPGVELDYGDLLDDANNLFPTFFANNGARHTLYDNTTTIYLGRLVDQDNNNGQPSASATGDDNNSTTTPASSLNIDVSTSNGHLTLLGSNITVGAVADGDTFAITNRGTTITFLFDSDGSTSVSPAPLVPTVVIPFNVSDTAAQIANKIVAAIGRSRIVNYTTGAGLSVASTAAGSVVTVTPDNDEDSARFGGELRIPFNPDTNLTPFDLMVSGSDSATGGYLDAWFDWNADGDWADPGEHVFTSRPVDIGLNRLDIVTPDAATAAVNGTQIAARFRLSLTGGLTPNNISVGGEVEDYIVTVYGGSTPVPTHDTYRVSEDGSLTTTDALGTTTVGLTNDNGVLANDTDADGNAMQVILVDAPDYAQSFTLNPDGTFTYTPLPNFNGRDTFTYLIRDNSPGALVSNTFGVATITVWEVNDPPVARDDQPNGTILTTPEDPAAPGYYTFNSHDLVLNDWTPFNAQPPHPYVPPLGTTDTEQGQVLQVSGVGATNTTLVATTAQGGTITLSGVGGTLTYQPPLNFNDTSGLNTNILDSFVYYIVDDGTTDGVADPKYNDDLANPVGFRSATAFIRVTPVNDPPVNYINGDANFANAPAIATNEDTAVALSTALGRILTVDDLDIADVEGVDQLSVTLQATHGTLTAVSGGGAIISGDGTATVTILGSRTQIAAALDGLSFLPDLNYNSTINLADPALITITTSDLGNFGAGGALADVDTLTITVNAVNDAPVNVVPAATQTLREDVAFTLSVSAGNAIQTSDVDVAEGTGKVTVVVSATHGSLTLATQANLDSVLNDGTHTVTLTGLLANVNTALNGLVYVTDANYNGTDYIQIVTSDLGNWPTPTLTDTDSVTLTIEPVNDAPVNQYGGANLVGIPARNVDEDVDLVFSGSTQVGVFDLDAAEGTGEVHVTLAVTNGIVTLGGVTGLTSLSGDGSALVTLQGPLANVNAALDNLRFRGNQDFNGQARIVMTTSDLGNKGWSLPVGGVFDQPLIDVDTITITVDPVNDDPINSIPAPQTVNEDTNLFFVGPNAVTVADVDVAETPVNVGAGQGVLEVTLAVQNGTITLGSPALVSITGGANGTSSVTFRGTKANLDAAMSNMFFRGDLNYNSAAPGATPARIVMTTTDLGNTGQGGAKVDVDTIAINVLAVNDAPTQVVPGTQFVREDELLTFSPADGNTITVADVDVLETIPANGPSGAGVLGVTLTVTNGTLTLGGTSGLTFLSGDGVGDASMQFRGTPADLNAALNGLTFVGNLNFNGLASFVITTSDLGNTGSGGVKTIVNTVTVNVAAVNDPPVNFVQSDANFPNYISANPGRFTMPEDTTLTLSAANLNRVTISDSADNTTGSVRVTLTAVNGVVSVVSTAGLTFEVGDGTSDPTMTFLGTIATINSRLNGMTFRPNNNFDGLAQLVITTNDLGQSGADGAQTDTDTVSIVVTPVNDAPSNLIPAAQTVAEDLPLVFSTANGNRISVSDDAGSLPVTVTLTAANGVLTLGSTAGLLSVSGNGSSTINLRGPLTSVNSALDGLTFLGTLNYNGPASIVIVSNDEGNAGGGAAQTDTDTVAITVTAVNDAPINLFNGASVFGTATTNDEEPVTFNATNSNRLTISDVDAGSGLMRVSLTGNNGVVTLPTRTGLTFTVGDGTADPTMTFTGTLVDVNAAMNNLAFRPSDYFSGVATLVVSTSDQGQTGSGGILVDTDTLVITVVAVNDPPVNSTPSTQTMNEDATLVFSTANGNLISVADDAITENKPISVTIAVRDSSSTPVGTLALGPTVPGGLTVNTGASLINLNGLVGDINTALAGLSFTPPLNYNGSVRLTVTSDDLGNSPFTIVSNVVDSTVPITIQAVNDAPVNTLPGSTINIPEDTTVAFASGQWSVADVDAASNEIDVTLSSTLGALSLGSISNLTFILGDGTSDATMKFRGTLANINAALNTLSFVPTANLSGDAVITITSDDRGFTGSGGTKLDTDSLTISIAPVNDAPVVTAPATQQAQEDGTLTLSTGNGNAFSVADDSAASEILVRVQSTQGKVKLGTTSGLALVTGDDSPTIDIRGTLTAVNNAINGLIFTPNANFTGDAVITVTVDDQGNTGGGGSLLGSNSATVTVLPRNDAPVNTAPTTQSTPEDIALNFGSAFGNQIAVDDIDAGVNPIRVQLAAVNGVLTLSGLTGLTFTAGDGVDDGTMTFTGTLASINTALNGLKFTPTADFFGSGSLTITTNDLGNTGFPVTALQDVDTVAITITSVNDAPRTAPLPRATNEDVPLTVAASSLMANDTPGPSNESSQTLTFTGVDPTSANGGTVIVVGSNVVYTPPANFPFASTVPLQDTFTYIVTDNGTTNGVSEPKSSRGTVTVTISPVNDAPIAVNDSFTMDEDTTLTRAAFNGVRANDTDAEGSPLTVTRVSGPTATGSANGGTLTLGADGSFTYTPPANYFGTVTFTYRVNDGQLNSNIATATITVNNVNEAPVAVANSASTSQGAPVTINVVANDTDSDGTVDASTVAIVSNPNNGAVVVNSNGTVTYTPTGTFQGTDTFQYTVRDNVGAVSNAATVTVTVGAALPKWQNPNLHLDVNADGVVAPLDALILINDINTFGARVLAEPATPAPPPYLDPDGNGSIEPRDVVLVIEFINNGSGEGEGSVVVDAAASADSTLPWGSLFVDTATSVTPTSSTASDLPADTLPTTTTRRSSFVVPVHDLSTAEGQLKAAEFRRASLLHGTDQLWDDLAVELSETQSTDATDAALEALFSDF